MDTIGGSVNNICDSTGTGQRKIRDKTGKYGGDYIKVQVSKGNLQIRNSEILTRDNGI